MKVRRVDISPHVRTVVFRLYRLISGLSAEATIRCCVRSRRWRTLVRTAVLCRTPSAGGTMMTTHPANVATFRPARNRTVCQRSTCLHQGGITRLSSGQANYTTQSLKKASAYIIYRSRFARFLLILG